MTQPLREPEADAQGSGEGECDCEPQVVSDTVAHGEPVPDAETLEVTDTVTHPEALSDGLLEAHTLALGVLLPTTEVVGEPVTQDETSADPLADGHPLGDTERVLLALLRGETLARGEGESDAVTHAERDAASAEPLTLAEPLEVDHIERVALLDKLSAGVADSCDDADGEFDNDADLEGVRDASDELLASELRETQSLALFERVGESDARREEH